MSFLVASDIHGSAKWTFLLASEIEKRKPDFVLLLGDLLYHGPRNPLPEEYDPAKVASILNNLPLPIMAIKGNCDSEVDQMVLDFHLAESAWLLDDGHIILARHGHNQYKVASNISVLSGHTHIPVAYAKDGVNWWNPGSVSLPKESFPNSFGFFSEGAFTVFDFYDNAILSQRL